MDGVHLQPADELMRPDPLAFVRALGSLRFTIASLLLLLGVVVALVVDGMPSSWLVPPLAALSLNLLAAILTNRVFRRQGALLVFHVALLALVVLVAAGRLTYLKGTVELADDEEFSGALLEREAGPLHGWDALRQLRFTNKGFSIAYEPGPLRREIRNRVEIPGMAGVARRQEITEHEPLVLAGYRFYPTGNKGFAPVFVWRPLGGEPRTGAVHLPSYPMHEHEQAMEWTLPGSDLRVWTMLAFDEVILPPDRASEFRLPERHRVVLRVGERRWELAPGEAVDLPQGRLEYRGLRTWMGYTVFYDWTIPWLLAACAAAAGALGLHFWSKFSAKPWHV